MRISTDLILNSLSYINPLNERELDLRGHKIPSIENLGAAKENDCIDFTDNDISIISNVPLMPRLKSLLFGRNRVTHIQAGLAKQIPNLTSLTLTANNIAELADLDPLGGFTKLAHLSLMGNPVASKEHYRYWVIWLCSSLRVLDFQRVKDAERTKAKELFGSADKPTELGAKIMASRSKQPHLNSDSTGAGINGNAEKKDFRIELTEEERNKARQMLKDAKSLDEIARLEKELNEGRIPGFVAGGDKKTKG